MSLMNYYHFEKTLYNEENNKNKDNMWDIFDKTYENIMIHDIDNFRINGLTCGIEVGLLQSDRNSLLGYAHLPQEYSSKYSSILIKRYKNLYKLIGNKTFIKENIECEIGNPQFCNYNDIKLNTNDLYNVYDLWQITRFLPHKQNMTILEIGAGFGNLANKIIKNTKNCKYISIDLPETLVLQHYYLSKVYPSLKIVRYKDIIIADGVIPDFDILLLPPFDLTILKNITFDLIIQTRGFSEMKFSVIKKYFDIIQRNLKHNGFLYLGAERYITYRGEEKIGIRNYPFDDNWNIIISQPAWLTTHGHDFLLERVNKSKYKFTEIIKSFPSVSPPPGPITKDYNIKKWIENNKMPDTDIL